jgi:hypothetical protein
MIWICAARLAFKCIRYCMSFHFTALRRRLTKDGFACIPLHCFDICDIRFFFFYYYYLLFILVNLVSKFQGSPPRGIAIALVMLL